MGSSLLERQTTLAALRDLHDAERAAARDPGRLRVIATLGADLVALVLAAFLASWAADAFDDVVIVGRLFAPFSDDVRTGVDLLILFIPYWFFVLYVFGLYRQPGRSIGGSTLVEALDGASALTAGSWLLLVALVVVDGDRTPVTMLVAFWLLALLVVPLLRWLVRLAVWPRAAFVERTLIIGAGEVGHTLADKIARHDEYRLELVGFLDEGEPRSNGCETTIPVLGGLSDLAGVIEKQGVDRVVVAFSRARHAAFLDVVRTCADHGVKVNIVPRLFEVVSSRAAVDDIEGIPLLDVAHVELSRFTLIVKRVFDLLVGGLLFLLFLPFMAAIALLVKLDSRGPVFFRQERMGRGGRTFRIFKFRSMQVGAECLRRDLDDLNEYSGPMFKMRRDPRVTRTGAWLRRWSLDELPQILNVLAGHMSLVGPRPLWVEEAKECRGWTLKRLDLTPGITGLWQVLGRSTIPFDEMVKLDYLYVTGWSLSWDVKLLLETVPAVLRKRGAY